MALGAASFPYTFDRLSELTEQYGLPLHGARKRPSRPNGSFLRLQDKRRTVAAVAKASPGQSAKDTGLLGPERHLLHNGRRRSVPARSSQCRNASAGFRSFRGRRLPQRDRRKYAAILRGESYTRIGHKKEENGIAVPLLRYR